MISFLGTGVKNNNQFSIVDGSHPSLGLIPFNKANLTWCCTGIPFASFKPGGAFTFRPGRRFAKIEAHSNALMIVSGSGGMLTYPATYDSFDRAKSNIKNTIEVIGHKPALRKLVLENVNSFEALRDKICIARYKICKFKKSLDFIKLEKS